MIASNNSQNLTVPLTERLDYLKSLKENSLN